MWVEAGRLQMRRRVEVAEQEIWTETKDWSDSCVGLRSVNHNNTPPHSPSLIVNDVIID